MEMSIYKTDNEVTDICVTYGLCKILCDNGFSVTITALHGRFAITTECNDGRDLLYFPLSDGDCFVANTQFSSKERQMEIDKMNDFISTRLVAIFDFFQGYEADNSLSGKSETIGIGTYFGTKGIRSSISPGNPKIPEFIRHLAFLGFMAGASYTSNDKEEANALLIPARMERFSMVPRPYVFIHENKETGEVKQLTYLSDSSIANLTSRMYCRTMYEYAYLRNSCSGVIYLQLSKTNKKPLPDKMFRLPIYVWDDGFIRSMDFILSSREKNNTKDTAAKFILDASYRNFRNLIQVCSKEGKMFDLLYLGGVLETYSEKIKIIYDNEVIRILGKGLSRLTRAKRGFEIQARLYNVSNELHITTIIRQICDAYSREYRYALIEDWQVNGIIGLLNDRNDAKVMADAILTYAKVFINFRKKEELINGEEESGTKEA